MHIDLSLVNDLFLFGGSALLITPFAVAFLNATCKKIM